MESNETSGGTTLGALGGTPTVAETPTASPEIPWERIEEVVDGESVFDSTTVERFEDAVADYLDVEYAVSVASGTLALEVALVALWKQAGERPSVVLPACCYPSIFQIAHRYDLDFKLVDNDRATMSVDPDDLERVLSDDDDAVVVPQPMGIVAKMDRIVELAERHDVEIIEDVGYSFGTTYGDRYAGTFGIGCFPLSQGKSLVTGEGGIITTNDERLYRDLRLVSHVGMSVEDDVSVIETGAFDPISHSVEMDFGALGVSARMSSLEAGLGIANLETFEQRGRAAAERFTILNEGLERIDGVRSLVNLAQEEDSKVGTNERFLLAYVEADEIPRDLLVFAMMEEGVPIKPRKKFGFAYSLSDEILRDYDPETFSNANYYSENNIFLPVKNQYPVEYYHAMVTALEKCLRELRDPAVRTEVQRRLGEFKAEHDIAG